MNKLSANQQTIVDAITSGLDTAAKIAEKTGLTKAAVSANMKPLRDKGIITTAEVDGHVVMSLTGEAKAARVDAAFDKATAAKKTAQPVILVAPREIPKYLGGRPRDVVQALIAGGYSKKAAKAHVYDGKAL